MNNLWGWVYYLILPLILYLKIVLIATTLAIGIMFLDTKVKFSQLFNIVVKTEFIFLLPMVFKTAWFYFFKTDYTLEELQNYMPLSLESIFGYENFEPWFIYPLQTANLFEVAYWITLAFLIYGIIQTSAKKKATSETLQHVPEFEFYQLNGKPFTHDSLQKHTASIFIYFHTDCDFCRKIPSDSTSLWTPLLWAKQFTLLGLGRDFHP